MFPGYDRTLKCANATLNGMMALLVVIAAVYAMWMRAESAWQIGLGIVASMVAMVWGGYYALLRIHVDEQGINIHGLMLTKHYSWNRLLRADLKESDINGIARCSIELIFEGERKLNISTALMEPENVRELAEDMRHAGMLPSSPQHKPQ